MRNISDIKSNKGIGGYTFFLAGELLHWDAVFSKHKSEGSQPDPEITRLVLVSIVSICESFYKQLFANYIDAGEPYISRAAKFHTKGKPEVNFEVLIGLKENKFSIGELYAYSLKYHSLKEIRSNYEILVEEDYLVRIQKMDIPAKEGDKREIDSAKSSIKKDLTNLDKVFHLRHQLVHEYPAKNVFVTLEEILIYIQSTRLILMATDRLFWSETNLKRPFQF